MALTTYSPPLLQQPAEIKDGVPERRRKDLLMRARSGDSIAFARLFDLYAERVYAYMHFHVPDAQAAEDLTARVFLKAWRSVPCYQPEKTPFNVWLYLLARKAVIDYARKERAAALREIISPTDEELGGYRTFEPCS